ncbi:MAG: SpoIIE family protein phosphatase [Pirellulales bacterium]|nr:SpoIIE family protein phosphatase [Thermoguttaceae bacterium]MDD4786196.1 SpoIIE family protein phosphatase [Pirellulales bacterium]NLZ01593.1 SpoIIE family protein phosphatase [Pirellulaceae bacterium]
MSTALPRPGSDESGREEMQSEEPAIAEEHSPAEARIRQLEERIRELELAEQRFRVLLESAPDAIVIVDSAGRIAIVNIQTENVFGYSRDELVGQSIEILVPERFRGIHRHHRAAYLENPHTREMGAGLELFGLRRDGSEFPAEISLSPARVGGSLLVFCAIRDVSQLRQAQTVLHERDVQLAAAQQIQKHLLPQRPPHVPGIDVLGVSYPAEFAAGDHFDYFLMPDDALAVVIGDVSGHGFGPALIMASVHTLIRALSQRSCDVCDILQHTNRFLCEETADHFFATVLFARIDTRSQRLEYASAGHPPAYVFNRQGSIKKRLESTGIPLGIDPDQITPIGTSIDLEDGDVVFMLTDGVFEIQSPDGEVFGVERAIDCVRHRATKSAAEVIDELYQTVLRFSHKESPDDDVTLVVLKVGPRPEDRETRRDCPPRDSDRGASAAGSGRMGNQ